MEIIVGIGALIGSPVPWAVAFFIVVMLMVFKGHLVPRDQVNALTVQSDKVEANLERHIELIRVDRDRSIDLLTVEKETWKNATSDAQEVARHTREQNDELIEKMEALDHLLSELRKLTGLPSGGDSSG